MRFRIIGSAIVLVGLVGIGTPGARGTVCSGSLDLCCVEHHACCDDATSDGCAKPTEKQSSIVNFVDTVMVHKRFIAGPVLIVHDDAKMARGEPCTTFYRFDPAEGPKEELVSFHCLPRRGDKAAKTTLSIVSDDPGIKRLVEYQIAGDTEAHGVPR